MIHSGGKIMKLRYLLARFYRNGEKEREREVYKACISAKGAFNAIWGQHILDMGTLRNIQIFHVLFRIYPINVLLSFCQSN